MGFLAPVGKLFSQPELVRNIFYGRLIRDEDPFLLPCLPFYSFPYCVCVVSDPLQSQGNFGSSESEHHSLSILISRDDLNQFRPIIHDD